MDLEDISNDAARGTDDEARVNRIAASVLGRLDRRRRRIRALRCSAALVCAAAIVLFALTSRPPAPAPGISEAPKPSEARKTQAEVPQVSRAESPSGGVSRPGPAARVESKREPARRTPRETAIRLLKDLERAAAEERLSEIAPGALADLDRPVALAIAAEIRAARLTGRRGEDWISSFAAELGQSGRADAWPILSAILDRLGPEATVIEAAGRLGEPRAVPIIKRWLYLGDLRSEAALGALRSIPGPESLEALLSAFEATRGTDLMMPRFRKQLNEAVREREGEICRYIVEGKRELRILAFKALAQLGTQEGAAAMVAALEDPASRSLARQFLVQVVGKDLGPRPEAWSRWLQKEVASPLGKEKA